MGKRFLQFILAACLVAGTVGTGLWLAGPAAVGEKANGQQPEEVESAVRVRAVPAERRTLADVVYGLGKSEAQPRKIAGLTSAVEGRVTQLLANPGDAVKEGQAIVELDKTVAAAVLAEKQTIRDEAVAALRLLESIPRPEEQQVARLAIEEAELTATQARANVARLRPLREKNEIPEAQMYDAELALQQAVIQQRSAEAQLSTMMLKPRPEAVEQGKAQIASAEAAVASAQAQLDLLSIRSPIDGILDSLTCRLGQTLSVGSPVGEVVDSRRVDVVVWLPVGEVQAVRLGQRARILQKDTLAKEADESELPHEVKPNSGEPVVGQVTFIGQVADSQTGNLPIRVAVDNAEGRLTLGEIRGVEITVRERKDVLAVPAGAIEDLGEGPILNVIREGKSVALEPRLGTRDKHWVEVLDTDLAPGEQVIVEGGYNLPEGTEVTAEPDEAPGLEPKEEGKAETGQAAEENQPETVDGGATP